MTIPEVKAIYEKYKLPIETSKSGGFHLLYRCAKNDGNRKLASRKKENGQPDAIIETRGEGGYFCAYPTPNYKVVKNDIFKVATISEIERAVLIDNAISMNEFFPSILKNEYEIGERPGDIYNRSDDSIADMKNTLIGAGWKHVRNHTWRRPGKDEGISATLGKVAPNVFYVFTANSYPFEPMKAYTPFQVLGLLKYNGDFKQAAQSVAPDKQLLAKKATITVSEIEKILEGARIDLSKTIDKPPTILSIKETQATTSVYKRVFTLGNFSCVIGKAKSKKTFVISLFTASLLNRDANEKFVSDLPDNKNKILYFDTEQGEYDSYNVIKRIERMAGTSTNLVAFNLRPFTPVERCQIIEHAFNIMGEKTGFCVIDGIADLANGINDEDEATRVVTILLRLSKTHNCHIVTVLHQNKNDNFATGHLGSAVMKKAEIVISVSKSKDIPHSSEVSNDMSRGVDFEPFQVTINQDGIPEITGVSKRKAYTPEFDNEKEDEFQRSDYDKQFDFPPKF